MNDANTLVEVAGNALTRGTISDGDFEGAEHVQLPAELSAYKYRNVCARSLSGVMLTLRGLSDVV